MSALLHPYRALAVTCAGAADGRPATVNLYDRPFAEKGSQTPQNVNLDSDPNCRPQSPPMPPLSD